MAGKALLTKQAKAKIYSLKQKGMKNADIATKITSDYNLPRVPSSATISKAIADGKTKAIAKQAPKSQGEILLQEAKNNKANNPITETQAPQQPTKPTYERPQRIQQEQANQAKANALDNFLNSNEANYNLNVSNEALSNFQNGNTALGALSQISNQLVNESYNPSTNDNSSNSILDSLMGSIPTTNSLDIMENDTQYQDLNNSNNSNNYNSMNNYQTQNNSYDSRDSIYKNDDVTQRNNNNQDYNGYSQNMIDETETNFARESISKLISGVGISFENNQKLYIEALIHGNQINEIGFVFNGNVYFPSFDFRYMYELQNGCNAKEGYVVIKNNRIEIIQEPLARQIFSEGLVNSVNNVRNWITANFRDFDMNNVNHLTYGELIAMQGDDSDSTAFIGSVNTLTKAKKLKTTMLIPKLNSPISFIIAVTEFDMQIISIVSK